MLEEIKAWKPRDKILHNDEYMEIEELFICLCKFCLGSSDNGRHILIDLNGEITQSLRLLITKMLKLGWGQKKINYLISYACYDSTCQGKVYGNVSLQQLMGGGVDFVDTGDGGLSDVQNKEFLEEKTKIIASLTDKEKEYFNLLYERNLPVTSVAKLMGVSKSNVSQVKKKLDKLLLPLEKFNNNTGSGVMPIGYKIQHHPAKESDKVNPYNVNPSQPFSKI